MMDDNENIEIKTLSKVITSVAVDLGLGAVAAGMKRWVTFIKATNEFAGANAIFLCSGTTATNAASGIAKDKQGFADQYDTIGYPDRPAPDEPLFSIAESKYLTAFANNGDMHLFLQYYDE
ncbi:MAG: hypothetical protein V1854_03455 [Methanobacteriota archaeon]